MKEKNKRKALHTSVAFLVLACAYKFIFGVPIYTLDALSLTFVILLTIGALGLFWEMS